jgi:uncharacterized protein (TIGR02145 family)
MKKPLLTTVFLLAALFCFAQSGSITVTSVQQRTDGSGLVDVYFNLSGPASAYNIAMQASFDAGTTYTPIPPAFLSGDIAGITPGSNKHIVWDGLGSFPNTFSTQARLELSATEAIGGGTPCPGMPTFTDPRDGQTYNTVQIGSQCWMKENLNYQTANSWCYANNTANCNNYGRLYTWQAALTACPPGWHLPSDAEWTQLVDYVISQGHPNNWNDPNGTGNALKSCRQVNSPLGGDCNTSEHPRWNSHSTHHGFDEFGFSALPGGIRATDGSFYGIGYYGYWWSSTEASSTTAWGRYMYYFYGNVRRSYYSKASGFSARCLRDN